MPAFGKDFVVATQYIRNLRGGSQPILVQASDGLVYVAKFTNNLQGPNLPFNESMGSELYRLCGLAVPSWKPLLVTDSFLDQNTDCWMQTPEGRLRPASGLCFGSRFLGGDGVRLLEILPGTSFKRVRNQASFWLAWLVDICAEHVDNRQAVFVEDAEGWLNAFFVDHGHLFGGPKADLHKGFLASRYLDPRIYPDVSSEQLLDFHRVVLALDADKLWQTVQALPDDWKTVSAVNGFAKCLGRLSNNELLQNVADTISDAYQRTNGFERREFQIGPKPPTSVLCLGVQAAGSALRRVAKRVDHPLCA
ncbi:MAG TPA: hypothetical protein VKG86_12390 [Terracidiphilus sp.]|nr:hypothetical protein [Terracidiphilus sp.]